MKFGPFFSVGNREIERLDWSWTPARSANFVHFDSLCRSDVGTWSWGTFRIGETSIEREVPARMWMFHARMLKSAISLRLIPKSVSTLACIWNAFDPWATLSLSKQCKFLACIIGDAKANTTIHFSVFQAIEAKRGTPTLDANFAKTHSMASKPSSAASGTSQWDWWS